MKKTLLTAALGLGLISALSVQSKELILEHNKLIKSAEVLGTLGTDLFGEQISVYNGSTEFVQTAVPLPGNSGLSVAVTRKFKVEDKFGGLSTMYKLGQFSDWELDVPYIGGTFGKFVDGSGWRVNTATYPFRRCSGPATLDQ